MSRKSWKFIRISEELHDNLTGICKKSQSYAQLIQALYDSYVEVQKEKENKCIKAN